MSDRRKRLLKRLDTMTHPLQVSAINRGLLNIDPVKKAEDKAAFEAKPGND